jgi:hypothetical protein
VITLQRTTRINHVLVSMRLSSGGPGRSPTLGEINGLQMVRVEIASLNAKEDFATTRTLRRSEVNRTVRRFADCGLTACLPFTHITN